jgi:hypothetical protein
MVVDFATTDLLCMRLCSVLSQAGSNPVRCKAEVGLSMCLGRRHKALKAVFAQWMRAVEARHLADLRFFGGDVRSSRALIGLC